MNLNSLGAIGMLKVHARKAKKQLFMEMVLNEPAIPPALAIPEDDGTSNSKNSNISKLSRAKYVDFDSGNKFGGASKGGEFKTGDVRKISNSILKSTSGPLPPAFSKRLPMSVLRRTAVLEQNEMKK